MPGGQSDRGKVRRFPEIDLQETGQLRDLGLVQLANESGRTES
jgi:hypothetical protein